MHEEHDNPELAAGSRAVLSIEISRVVSRVLSGETIDTAAQGEELATKYPDLEMSGPMISEAIVRAAGMMGMIRDGIVPVRPPVGVRPGEGEAIVAANGAQASPDPAEERGLDIGGAGAEERASAAHAISHSAGSANGRRGLLARGAVAAIRRAFFRN